MFTGRRFTTLLPLLMGLVSLIVINGIPIIRAFVLNEPGFITAGWALFFVTVPVGVLQFAVGGFTSAVLAFIKNERAHRFIAYAIAGLIAVSLVPLLIFVCQPA